MPWKLKGSDPQAQVFVVVSLNLMYPLLYAMQVLFFSRRRRHTRFKCDWSSDVCSSDLLARDHDASVFHEVAQQFELAYREVNRVAPARDFHVAVIERGAGLNPDGAELVDGLASANRRAAQQCFDAGHQLQHVEGFGDVIVRTQLEADNLVRGLTTGGEHEDGRAQAGDANVATEVESVASREHDVQDNQVEGQSCRFFETGLPVEGRVDNVALPAQTVTESHLQSFFIFYQQNVFLHGRVNESDSITVIVSLLFFRMGRCSVNTLPPPSLLTTVIRPPMASAIFFAKGNPRPVP